MLRKFFTTVAVGSLFVGGLAATHLAYAQPGAKGGHRGGMMAMADTNKDGKISKAELTAGLEARFAKMDVDKDGQITQKDRDAMRQQRQDARFAALDADKNGQISKAEFTAAHEARADKRQERRAEAGKPGGRDGRGWGGRGGHRRGGMMGHGGPGGGFGDANKDGAMTKAEFMARPIAMFDKADANKDGFVTADEMKAARQMMRAEWKDRKGPPAAPQN
ncbi:EF-hand domain-containing protein [Sphingobium cupriresistens]|uniref:Calcium-binding protein n=1 Tax=Sphingobium cupriresistens LL01 TaxID=1420583 RepID=A0A0J7XSE8_9SPHN|nr:calcium-binding protein [Sphingobium cupriresistens]KMS54564.1 calcium-binding protein [Sphingobium cupriresistens LL01]